MPALHGKRKRSPLELPRFEDTWTLPGVSREEVRFGCRERGPRIRGVPSEAIRLAQLGDNRSASWPRTPGISDVTLRNWIKQERAERGERPGGLSQDEREELKPAA